jgi:hypothetical protein
MTNTQKQISQSLEAQGVNLTELVKYQRRKGRTWQQVAEDLDLATGVLVSRETLRKWFQ